MPLLKFRSFTAASRRRNMIAFGMHRLEAGADLEVIEDVGSGLLGVSGTQDGDNKVFTLSAAPAATNFVWVRNGVGQKGGGVDYTLFRDTITCVIAPLADDILMAVAIGGE